MAKAIKKADLMVALDAVAPGLASKAIVEQTDCYIFDRSRVYTYNDRISISYPIDIGIRASVKAKDFFKVIKGVKEKIIKVTHEDDILLVNSRETEAGLSTDVENTAAENMIEGLGLDSIDWKKAKAVPKDFIDALKVCQFSVSKDMTSDNLFCVCVEGNTVLSTDNLRISLYTLEKEFSKKKQILIPYTSVQELVKYEVTHYHVKDNWIHFLMDNGATFSCILIMGEFDDYKEFMEFETHAEIELPEELPSTLADVEVMCDGDSRIEKECDVKIRKGEIEISAKKARGWIKKRIDFEDYDGEELSFTVNPEFLREVLEHATIMKIGNSAVKLEHVNFSHVLILHTEE